MITILEIGEYDNSISFSEQTENVREYIRTFITNNSPINEIKEFCGRNVDGEDIYRIKKQVFVDTDKNIKIILNNIFLNASNNKRAFKVSKRLINIENNDTN